MNNSKAPGKRYLSQFVRPSGHSARVMERTARSQCIVKLPTVCPMKSSVTMSTLVMSRKMQLHWHRLSQCSGPRFGERISSKYKWNQAFGCCRWKGTRFAKGPDRCCQSALGSHGAEWKVGKSPVARLCWHYRLRMHDIGSCSK